MVPTCKKTLSDLGLDYVDLYLIHWPFAVKEGDDLNPFDEEGKLIPSNVDYVDTWKQMEECVKLGLTKSIGLSNFNSQQIQRILDIATIKPAVHQVPNIDNSIISTHSSSSSSLFLPLLLVFIFTFCRYF